jgi:hypothetical protein
MISPNMNDQKNAQFINTQKNIENINNKIYQMRVSGGTQKVSNGTSSKTKVSSGTSQKRSSGTKLTNSGKKLVTRKSVGKSIDMQMEQQR